MAAGSACMYSGSPVADMIDVMLSTRSGCSMAIVRTIIPPIGRASTMWALVDAERTQQAEPVVAHARTGWGTRIGPFLGRP